MTTLPAITDAQDFADNYSISTLSQFDDETTEEIDPAAKYICNLKDAILAAATTDIAEETIATVLDDIMKTCAAYEPNPTRSRRSGTWPTCGDAEDDRLFEEFASHVESLGVPRHKLVKFSGRLASPVQITFHYPPERKCFQLLSAIDQKSPCLPMYMSKMGLSSASPDTFVCWTESFFLRTDIAAREHDKAQPYNHEWSEEVVAYNDAFVKRMLDRSQYRVRAIVVEVNVLKDIERAKKEGDILFKLPNRNGDYIQLYRQP